jgi:signal transduction histidine kinase
LLKPRPPWLASIELAEPSMGELLHRSSFDWLLNVRRNQMAASEIRGFAVWASPDSVAAMADRMRALLEAGVALTSELSLEALLQRLVENAAELTEARYAALGVIDASGSELERFVTTGMDPQTHAAIGDLPRGRGILGVLIREAEVLRLHDLSDDPRSVGFPPNHPPMHTFLGVPLNLRGVAYGNLYLTEKAGGEDFNKEDEEIVTLLAGQAAVAIENARLYESATRWSQQLESLVEVGAALARETELPKLLELVARRLRELIGARLVVIAVPAGDDSLRIDAAHGEDADEFLGMRLDHSSSKSGRVLDRRRSERLDSLIDDPEVDREFARRMGMRAALFVPLVLGDRAIGVIQAFDKLGADRRFSNEDLRVAETFAAQASIAVDTATRVARDSLQRAVEGQELERRRLARELHDETGQALTSILLGLRTLEESGGEDVGDAVGDLRELVVQTLQDVRRLAVELRPTALDDFGLGAALERLTSTFSEQTGTTVEFESRLGDKRLPSDVETVLYRIVQEALTNVVKHAQAEHVSIVLQRKGDGVTAVIEDDGRGFAGNQREDGGLGLVGMKERVELVNGRLKIESAVGAGTTLVVEVPLT